MNRTKKTITSILFLCTLSFTSGTLFAQAKYAGLKEVAATGTPNKVDKPIATKRAIGYHAQKKDYQGKTLTNDYYYYRNLLSANKQKAYDDLYNKLAGGNSYIVPGVKISKDDIYDVAIGLMYDNPELFWLTCSYNYSYNGDGLITDITFGTIKLDDIKKAQQQFKEKTEPILYFASKLDNDMQRVKYIHDYLCKSLDYVPSEDYDQTTYSALVAGKTVCTGYAKSFLYFMQMLDIPATLLTGDHHAWNMVKLNGSYYEMDVTWDDTAKSNQYFNLVHNDMRKVDGHHPCNDTQRLIIAFPSTSNDMEYKRVYGNTPVGVPYTYQELAHFKADGSVQIATVKPTSSNTTPASTAATAAQPKPTTITPQPQPTAAQPKPTTITPQPQPTAAQPKPTTTTPQPQPTVTQPKPTTTTPQPQPTVTQPKPTTTSPAESNQLTQLDEDLQYYSETDYTEPEDGGMTMYNAPSIDAAEDSDVTADSSNTSYYPGDDDYSFTDDYSDYEDPQTENEAGTKGDIVSDWRSYVQMLTKKIATAPVDNETMTVTIVLKDKQTLNKVNRNLDTVWDSIDKSLDERDMMADNIEPSWSNAQTNIKYTLNITVYQF